MNDSKASFIKLALDQQILKFGQFTLKSGRISPYFFNAGLMYHGHTLQQMGQFYAQTLLAQPLPFTHLFGPAYKGISLATATAIALAAKGKNCTVTFNRKEAKTHGEKGQLIGAPLSGDTFIIDDVITAGVAFREAQQLIKEQGGTLKGVVIALDRRERGLTAKSALAEIKEQGIAVYSLATLDDLLAYLTTVNKEDEVKKIIAYQQQYGCVD